MFVVIQNVGENIKLNKEKKILKKKTKPKLKKIPEKSDLELILPGSCS